jgi:hypothetical protein
LVDLATEAADLPRELVLGRPEELCPDWKKWSCYKSDARIIRLMGNRRAIRYVDKRAVGTNFGGQEFPTLMDVDVLRPYMARAMGRSRWGPRDTEAMEELNGMGLPFFTNGVMPTGPMVLVDINYFYWQLMQHFSTQVEYRPASGSWAPTGGYWLDSAEVARHKVLYAVLATSVWRSRTVTLWVKGEATERKATQFYQPQAWRLLCDIAHAIAGEAVEQWGCSRMMVDGYWFPPDVAPSFMAWLEERWGMLSTIKEAWEPGGRWPLWPNTQQLRPISELVRKGLRVELTGGDPIPAEERTPPMTPEEVAYVMGAHARVAKAKRSSLPGS